MVNREQYERMYGLPVWFDLEEAEFMADIYSYEGLSKLQIIEKVGSIAAVERLGLIPAGDSLEVFEFGSGYGEALVALNMYAKQRQGVNITGSEILDPRIPRQVCDVLEYANLTADNGLSHLNDNQAKYDLIVANMFGPSYYDTERVNDFIPLASKSLTQDGVILMNSDKDTMDQVSTWLETELDAGKFEFIKQEDLPSGLWHIPHVVIRS